MGTLHRITPLFKRAPSKKKIVGGGVKAVSINNRPIFWPKYRRKMRRKKKKCALNALKIRVKLSDRR